MSEADVYGWPYLSLHEVLVIRQRLAQSELGKKDFGGVQPIYPNLLASAVGRQVTGYEGKLKYERPVEIAATLFYGLATNHAFENGNKRTALVACLVFLDRSQLNLVNTSQDELLEMATSVVGHTMPLRPRDERNDDTEVRALASWLRQRTRRRRAGDRHMDFVELKERLEALGCTFDNPEKNFIRIRRGTMLIKTRYPRANFDVSVSEVKNIRKRLGLVDMPNQDFYDLEAKVDRFVLEYKDVLSRLADH
jgi:death-on-curing family protein